MSDPVVCIIGGIGANLTSIQASLARIRVKSLVTQDPKCITASSHVLLPGVGAMGYAMKVLQDRGLIDVIRNLTQPVLGICLGMQLLCRYSEEDNMTCLNIIPCDVRKIQKSKLIPHLGWNTLDKIMYDRSLLFKGISASDCVYFLHSFAVEINKLFTLAVCEYGMPFSAAIRCNNFYGVQFHPEKSGKIGEKILKNFIFDGNFRGC